MIFEFLLEIDILDLEFQRSCAMQQFTVPQFIEVEDRIIGPVTARQFVIMLATCLLCAAWYKIFPFEIFIVLGVATLAVGSTFSFVRINGMPFHFFALNIIQTMRNPSLRVWQVQNQLFIEQDLNLVKVAPPDGQKHYSTSRLNELSLVVDTAGVYQGEEATGTEIKAIKQPDKIVK